MGGQEFRGTFAHLFLFPSEGIFTMTDAEKPNFKFPKNIIEPTGTNAERAQVIADEKAAEVAHQALNKPADVEKKKKGGKEYFACYDGMRFVFKDGKEAHFEGGCFSTDIDSQIEELDALCKMPGQHQISLKELPVMRSDAQVLKGVGGRGTMSSQG